MNFRSDNICAISPPIMEAIIKANHGAQKSYGQDNYSKELKDKLSDIFEKQVSVFLANTGTAANCLALTAIIKPYEFIACHKQAHINTDECGAPSFFTGGANLLLIEGGKAKMDAKYLSNMLEITSSLRPHSQKTGCISLTQATELGTIYSNKEIIQISEIAKKYALPVHMDGARFTNSLANLGCSPADITWKAGIDVMSLGATKNGCLNAEAVVFFNHDYAKDFDYLQKRAGQLMSKTRFFAAQFLAYFEDDLWLKNAQHANNQAQILKNVFEKYKILIKYPVEANEVFPIMTKEKANFLNSQGCSFSSWGLPEENLYRFVTSCFTEISQIEELDKCLAKSITSLQ